MLEVGYRVVRGRDWQWDDQDGGEGHAGTVVDIGVPSNIGCIASISNYDNKTPNKTVIVQWDQGSRSNYRVGYQDAYDLLIFDNAAAGVQHLNIVCDGCKTHGIVGIRWKCSQCLDFDLCTQCYMSDVHDLRHTFQRFLTSNSLGVQLTSRENCTKIALKGIFIEAIVTRGPDWEWGNQDGGRGQMGKVIDIRGWDNESRSVATVAWSCGNTNVYRLGYRGCVDLCYVKEASAGTYYKEHLPLLGLPSSTGLTDKNNSLTTPNCSKFPNVSQLTFVPGDKVKVSMDVDNLKVIQAGHGGWNPRMADFLDKIGTVHRITDKGDIRVQYDEWNSRWTFHPGALTKIISQEKFSLGDIVRVKSDANAVKQCQRGHGEWTDAMKVALGKTGKVIKIYSDGDMRVQIEGHTWTFNPLSVTLVPAGSEAANSFIEAKRGQESTDVEVEKLLRDATRGELGIPAVKEFLQKYPNRVDARGGPNRCKKTCLQLAAHLGQKELCIILLDAGAKLCVADEEGDTPLHYAAFGNKPEIMELLLDRNAAIDAVNNGKCSALHIAVNKQHPECVKTLIRYGCNVNLQDSYGDTSLHDAISKDDSEIIDVLCARERLNVALLNNRGFNVLQHAALKGNAHATRKLVARSRHLVNLKKHDGFTALHLAVLNGHREVAEILLAPRIASGGQAEVDTGNNRRQTPLHLAICQGHWALVELLVQHGANVALADEDGDTALHMAVAKCLGDEASAASYDQANSPILFSVSRDLAARGAKTELALICFLVDNDATGTILEHARNSSGKSPMDLLLAEPVLAPFADLVKSYGREQQQQQPPAGDGTSASGVSSIPESATGADARQPAAPTAAGDSAGAPQSEIAQVEGQLNRLEIGGGDASYGNCANQQRRDNFAGRSKNRQETLSNPEELANQAEQNKVINGYNEKEVVESNKEKDKDLERLRYLETRIADLEEANMCSICMERLRNVVFLCGHGACGHCAAPLELCHMCRQTITKKINIY